MRILMKVSIPNEPFNALVREGRAGQMMEKVLGAVKPEAAYFAEMGGERTGILIVDCPAAHDIPRLAEPFFLTFNARVEFHPCMTPEDLGKSGLDAIGNAWR